MTTSRARWRKLAELTLGLLILIAILVIWWVKGPGSIAGKGGNAVNARVFHAIVSAAIAGLIGVILIRAIWTELCLIRSDLVWRHTTVLPRNERVAVDIQGEGKCWLECSVMDSAEDAVVEVDIRVGERQLRKASLTVTDSMNESTVEFELGLPGQWRGVVNLVHVGKDPSVSIELTLRHPRRGLDREHVSN